MTGDYFDSRTVNRQRLLWTVATRRQLERWEPLVATILNASAAGRQLDGQTWWLAEIEHHLALVAARNLLHALDLPPGTGVSIDQTLRDELKEGRDLHEHWLDYMPVFNVTPHKVGSYFGKVNWPPRATSRNRPLRHSTWRPRPT